MTIGKAAHPLVGDPCLADILPVARRNQEHSQHQSIITARVMAYHASAYFAALP